MIHLESALQTTAVAVVAEGINRRQESPRSRRNVLQRPASRHFHASCSTLLTTSLASCAQSTRHRCWHSFLTESPVQHLRLFLNANSSGKDLSRISPFLKELSNSSLSSLQKGSRKRTRTHLEQKVKLKKKKKKK